MRKTSDNLQTDGHSTEYLKNIPQNCQGHKKQGETENLSLTRGG